LIVDLIEAFYRLLWGDLFTLPVAGGIGISFMVVLLFAAGIGFTLRTRLLPVRLFRDMIGAVCEKKQAAGGLSSFQTLVISTATRVGMGNLVGVVAAVSAGGAGAVFWMWVTALLGASTSFVESTLAQKYRVPDPLYGGWRGGPAYYLHVLAERKRGKKLRRSVCAALFAVSGLICWCGISQVISNSVSSAFENAFHVPPLATTVVLTLLAALIVLRKNATVKSLDFIVPVMAVCYFVITVGIVVLNFRQLPAVLALKERARKEGASVMVVSARIEEELSQLESGERELFLAELGLESSGLERLIKASYSLLGLISFLTAGPKEVRAWTIVKGTKAPQAAGKIHSDFERGFIRAEIVAFDDLIRCGSYNAAREKGLVRSEGKDYVMQDGDVTLFRFNV